MSEYFALTVWQPWASLIAAGKKLWEFRPQRPPAGLIGGIVAIHAGKRKVNSSEIQAMLDKMRGPEWMEMGLIRSAEENLRGILIDHRLAPLSCILCLAQIGEPVTGRDMAEAIGADFAKRSQNFDNWAIPVQVVRNIFPFIPAKGRQGWWKVQLP